MSEFVDHPHAAEILAWRNADAQLAQVKAHENELRLALVEKLFPGDRRGTSTVEVGGGYTLACVKKSYFNLDDELTKKSEAKFAKLGDVGKLLWARLVRSKPELRIGEYFKLTPAQRKLIAPALTIKAAMPSLELREPPAG